MPEPTSFCERGGVSYIVTAPERDTKQALALSELSDRDKPWDSHRSDSDTIASHYRGTEYQKYSERIRDCSQLLDFLLTPDQSAGEYKLKLASARFCRVRTCVICTWRKSLMYRARAFKAIPPMVQDHPRMRFLFLTLTLKNCPITELRATITHLNRSFARLTKRKTWPGIGYLKSVEVTRGRNGSAHPHLHVLVGVEPSYFGRNYIRQDEWVKLWRQSLRVDYDPMLDVQALKPTDSMVGLLTEVIKYQVKPNDLLFADRDWFLEYTSQIHRTQAIAFGGSFREYFRDFDREATQDEMLGKVDESDEVDLSEGHLLFGWRRVEKKYRLLNS